LLFVDMFGKWYICDDMFKLSVMPLCSNKIFSSSSLNITNVETCDMWHAITKVKKFSKRLFKL